MKTFFEDLGKRFGETAEVMSNKASEAVEVQKLKSQIRTLERGNEGDLTELGQIIYERYQAGEDVGEEAAGLCEAIRDREESIEKYRQKISDVKGSFHCEVCGKIVTKEMSYCPYCGEKVPESIYEEEEEESAAEKVADVVEEAAEKVEETAEKAVEAAEEAVEDLAEKVKETAEQVAEKAEEAADKPEEKEE